MSRLVVDASVAVKWFLPEQHSITALRLLEEGHELFAPDLIVPECGNVLWKKWLHGELESTVSPAILTDLGRMNIRIVPTSALVEEAAAIAVAARRSFYDSVYLALASVSGGKMVTCDAKLCNALQGTPLADLVLLLSAH
jgi:predicted nucleic acid-binding protein